jgi:hypothetical protein
MPRTEEETWDLSREVVRTHGLPPAPENVSRIRSLLEDEMQFKKTADYYPGHEYMRALCALLWANGEPEDAVRVAAAKFEDMDAGCMIDSEFLVCGDLDAVRACLQNSDLRSSKSALAWLAGGLSFSREELIASKRARFGLA